MKTIQPIHFTTTNNLLPNVAIATTLRNCRVGGETMASKVRNLRITQTKQFLINAFYNLASQKDFEKITIANITKEAQVNRATFYAHFNDKYDLIDYIMGILPQHLSKVIL